MAVGFPLWLQADAGGLERRKKRGREGQDEGGWMAVCGWAPSCRLYLYAQLSDAGCDQWRARGQWGLRACCSQAEDSAQKAGRGWRPAAPWSFHLSLGPSLCRPWNLYLPLAPSLISFLCPSLILLLDLVSLGTQYAPPPIKDSHSPNKNLSFFHIMIPLIYTRSRAPSHKGPLWRLSTLPSPHCSAWCLRRRLDVLQHQRTWAAVS